MGVGLYRSAVHVWKRGGPVESQAGYCPSSVASGGKQEKAAGGLSDLIADLWHITHSVFQGVWMLFRHRGLQFECFLRWMNSFNEIKGRDGIYRDQNWLCLGGGTNTTHCPGHIISTMKHSSCSIMLWGCIAHCRLLQEIYPKLLLAVRQPTEFECSPNFSCCKFHTYQGLQP